VAERGDAQLDTLRYALQAAGEFVEVEAIARREVAALPQAFQVRYRVDAALAAQGRVREALRWLDETKLAASTADADRDNMGSREAQIAAVTGSAERCWRYAAGVEMARPKSAGRLAVLFELLGDDRHAEELARALDPGSPAGQQYQALRAWRGGDTAGALAILERAEADDPWPNEGIAPSYLMAEIAAATGDDVGTLAAVGRFQRLPPDRIWRAWAYPRSLYLAAVAHAHLGEGDAARGLIDRLLALLARADPDVPLVKRARALRAELYTRQHLTTAGGGGR